MNSTSVLFGVALSLWTFIVAKRVHQRFPTPLLNPLLFAPLLVIGTLLALGIPYERYNEGGSLVSFFLGPATVALAVPLYRQLPVIRRMWLPILVGVTTGAATGIVSSIALVKWLGGTDQVLLSMVSRSTTTPIAVGITESLGGLSP
ncbi:MAG: LrgB family protein, partial [Bacillota bacterium]